MGKNNNSIEINGKKYDAATGAPLTIATPAPKQAVKIPKTTAQSVAQAARTPAPAHNRTLEQSQTLMRAAVKKPGTSLKRHLNVQTRTDILVKQPSLEITPKLSFGAVSTSRLQHAKTTSKSSLVNHFKASAHAFTGTVAPATAQLRRHAKAQAAPKPKISADELFQKAIEHADSHLQPAPTHTKQSHTAKAIKQTLGLSAAVVVAAFVVGVVAYNKIPTARVEFASLKAGFSASLPNYVPAGYTFSGMNNSAGQITVRYKDATNTHPYVIIEQRTTYDSQSLRDSFVAPLDDHFQTFQTTDQTIYLYGSGNASWISNGIWYQLISNGNLTNSQLLKIVTSL